MKNTTREKIQKLINAHRNHRNKEYFQIRAYRREKVQKLISVTQSVLLIWKSSVMKNFPCFDLNPDFFSLLQNFNH